MGRSGDLAAARVHDRCGLREVISVPILAAPWATPARGPAGSRTHSLALDEGLAIGEKNNKHPGGRNPPGSKVSCCWRSRPSQTAAAEETFRQAIEIAQRQLSRAWELLATTSLSRLWQRQGRHGEARSPRSRPSTTLTRRFHDAGPRGRRGDAGNSVLVSTSARAAHLGLRSRSRTDCGRDRRKEIDPRGHLHDVYWTRTPGRSEARRKHRPQADLDHERRSARFPATGDIRGRARRDGKRGCRGRRPPCHASRSPGGCGGRRGGAGGPDDGAGAGEGRRVGLRARGPGSRRRPDARSPDRRRSRR